METVVVIGIIVLAAAYIVRGISRKLKRGAAGACGCSDCGGPKSCSGR